MATIALLIGPPNSLAQGRRGGEGINATSASRPIICVYDCRDLSRGEDLTGKDLKTFERLMAVQATADQSAAFAKVLEYSQDAAGQLKNLRELLQKVPPQPGRPDALNQALERARASNQNFLASFSQVQKTELKDIVAKLANADSGLARETKALEETIQAPHSQSENVASSAANLEQALGSFRDVQLALGRAMSVLPAEGQDLTFHLPQVTSSVDIDGQAISLPGAGAIMRTSAAGGRNFFNVRFVTDLGDLQDNATDIFRSELNHMPRCGERIEVQRAMLLPQSAASLAVVQLHHERWFCPPGTKLEGSEQLVVSDEATVEISLSPSIEPGGGLHLGSEISRVEANGFLRDSIQSGSLGATLREQVCTVVLSAVAKGADLTATLPPAAQAVVTMQKARFEDAGAGQLNLVLDGELQLSDEQTKQFAAQLKQQLSAQAKSPQ